MACRSRQRLPAGLTSDSSHALASRACLESRAAIAPPSHDDHALVEADIGSTVDTASQTHGDVTINRPLVSSPCCKQRSDHKDTGQSEEAISLDHVCRASCWSDRDRFHIPPPLPIRTGETAISCSPSNIGRPATNTLLLVQGRINQIYHSSIRRHT